MSEQDKSPPELPHEGPPWQGFGPRPYEPPAPVPPPVPAGWEVPVQQAAPFVSPPESPQALPPGYGQPPAPPARSSSDASDGQTVQTVGYVMAGAALIVPILGLVGLVLGIITATKPNRGHHGAAIISLSLAFALLAAIFWAGVYEDGAA